MSWNTICRTALVNNWGIPKSRFQYAIYLQLWTACVHTVYTIFKMPQPTCKSCKNVEFGLILLAYPCKFSTCSKPDWGGVCQKPDPLLKKRIRFLWKKRMRIQMQIRILLKYACLTLDHGSKWSKKSGSDRIRIRNTARNPWIQQTQTYV